MGVKFVLAHSGATEAQDVRQYHAEVDIWSLNEVTGEWRRLHNEGLLDLLPAPIIIAVIKSRRIEVRGTRSTHVLIELIGYLLT